jgi:hypothetical protein
MTNADAELALAHRYYALASNPYDRPLVVRRSTIPTLITLIVSAYPAVRRIAAETIYLLCDHPQNPEFLLTTNLLNALNAEISIQASASQSDCGSTSPMDAESDDNGLVEALESETLTFLELSRDILEQYAQQQDEVLLSDDGSSSPQARPAFSSSTARPMLRRRGQDITSEDEPSRRQQNRQTVTQSSSSWLRSSWKRTRSYLYDLASLTWQWASTVCLWLMSLSVRRKDSKGEQSAQA